MSKANLPGLTPPTTGNAALDRWIQSVTETIQVREGARGDKQEQVLTRRDLADLGLDTTKWARPVSGDSAKGVLVQQSNGSYAMVSTENFSDALRSTKLYRDLSLRIDDASRFDGAPDRVKSILLQSLADEAAARGADIRNVEYKLQSSSESMAYALQEVTASVNGAAAGVRDMAYANATANRATAGKVTQVTARLDNFGGGAATVESTMTAVADRATGLEAQYTLKARAGGVFAGIGLAASSPTAGAGTSAIILQANKFALVGPSETIADPVNPPVNRVPFGYDSTTNTIYINGTVRINAGGTALQDSVGVPGPTGPAGSAGAAGARGSLTAYGARYSISSSSWSADQAQAVIYNTLNGTALASEVNTWYLRIGDQVTLSNGSTFAETRYWGGTSWLTPGVVIDGNLLVSGTLSASKLAAGTINANLIIKSSGYIWADGTNWTAGSIAAGYFNSTKTAVYGVYASGGSGGAGVLGASGTGSYGVSGVAETSGAVGVYAIHYITGQTALKVVGRSTFDSQIANTTASGTAPITVSSTTMCPGLNASYVGGYPVGNLVTTSPTFYVSGITSGGSNVGFTGTGKPGSTSGATNKWLAVTIAGVQYAIPAWDF